MSKVTFIVNKDVIHIAYDGKYTSVNKNDQNYNEIVGLIKDGKHDEIASVFERKNVSVKSFLDGTNWTVDDGVLKDDENGVVPSVLAERMIDLRDSGFPVTYLINFWNNLKQNPSMRSREQLYTFLEQKGHPITEDGCFVAYRGVRRDFKDKHTGTFDNSPGSVCEMPRHEVDDDPTRTCSRGLHVAAFNYANSFGEITVEVKVNPRDVVAVPTDYNGQKMRVCRFEVIQVCEKMNTNSGYSFTSDAVWGDVLDDGYEDEFVSYVIDSAIDYKDRYKDRAMLAARIEEDLDYCDVMEGYSVVDILTILNENESEWL